MGKSKVLLKEKMSMKPQGWTAKGSPWGLEKGFKSLESGGGSADPTPSKVRSFWTVCEERKGIKPAGSAGGGLGGLRLIKTS